MFKIKKQNWAVSESWFHGLDFGNPEKRIVNSNGFTEGYKRSKLALSIHQACMRAGGYVGEAEMTALQVCKKVESWLEQKYEVTSSDITRKATEALRIYHPSAAFEYNVIEEDDSESELT